MAEAAARYLYHGTYKEYIDAKEAAAEDLDASTLPSNREVAEKLLEYALSLEGEGYWERLRELRLKALRLMEALERFRPRLVGSVWRGVVKPGSDIDVEVDFEDPEPVAEALRRGGFQVKGVEPIDVPEPLRMGSLWRIRTEVDGAEAEVILKEHQAYLNPPACDIYGDPRKGLSITELRRIIKENPAKLNIPGVE